MGVMAIALSLMAISIFRDLAFENQRESLVHLANVKKNDILEDLTSVSSFLGIGVASKPEFKKAYLDRNNAAIQHELDEQFYQYYVTADVVDLKKLYVYDMNFNKISESSKGDTNIAQGSQVCVTHIENSRKRKNAKRIETSVQLCQHKGLTYHSVISAIGGLKPIGYIQVVTNPSHNLRHLETGLNIPIRIFLPTGEVEYQSQHWPEKNAEHDFLIAKQIVETDESQLAYTIEVASHVNSLLEKLAQTRFMIIMTAVLVTWVTVWLVMWLLQHTTVNPLRNLTQQLRDVRQDKSRLGEQVTVKGNAEVRELARDFNEMTSELRDLYASLQDMAFTDSLTELPNRALFQDRINQLTELSKRENRSFCVLMMDLDRFKEVNDTLGHEYGDKLLQLVSARLQNCVRKSDTVTYVRNDTIARLGGDEFAMILPTATSAEGVKIVANRIIEIMTQPIKIDEHTFNVGISVGISMFPEDGDDVTTLMRHADIAMYEAKKNHQGYTFYDKTLDKQTPITLALGHELRDSIENDKLDLHFQPKIDFYTGQVCGTEALARWHHPEKGFIPPDQFVKIAEKIGLIEPLTLWVLNRALEQCGRWNHKDPGLGVAVNLSALSLQNESVITLINNALKDWKISPSLLSLELTESAVMSDPQQALEILSDLDGMGVKISVDDFGTGYSSLSYLKRLPVDEIKIDRSFVMDMCGNKNDEAIVKSTIDLAHNMNLRVIAEGIENIETYKALKRMGCDMGQGYYMGRPVSGQDLLTWLNDSPWGVKRNK